MPLITTSGTVIQFPPGIPGTDLLGVGTNVYTYAATDLITGEVLADSIPLTVQDFSRQINAAGTLNGTLTLQNDFAINQPYIEALEASRCVLWVLQNGFPVWSGIVWDWPHSTIMPPATLPIAAATIESLFDHRLVTDTIDYAAVDLFTVFTDLARYGISKNSPYIDPKSPKANRLPELITDSMAVAGLIIPDVTAGVPWSATYTYSDYRKVSDVWSDLIAAGNFEYTVEPGFDGNGNLTNTFRLGYTQLTAPDPSAFPGLVFSFPGNVIDYGYPRTGSQSANGIWATAPPNGNAATWQAIPPHGFDLAQIREGYPLLEDTVSWNGSTVTSQSQVDQFADSQVQLRTEQMTLPQLIVGGAGQPPLPEVVLGGTAWFTAASPLHPPAHGTPGLTVQVRIAGWTLVPPSPGQPEQMTVSASAVFTGS